MLKSTRNIEITTVLDKNHSLGKKRIQHVNIASSAMCY